MWVSKNCSLRYQQYIQHIRWLHFGTWGCQRFPHGNTLPDTASRVPRSLVATLCPPGYHGSLGVPGHSLASAMINYCPNEMWELSKCQRDDMKLSMWASEECCMTEAKRQLLISCKIYIFFAFSRQLFSFYCKLGWYLYVECKQAELVFFTLSECVISPLILHYAMKYKWDDYTSSYLFFAFISS